MRLTARELARRIDISAVRSHHCEDDVRELVRHGLEHRFVALHVLPCWVPFLKAQLAGVPDVLAGAPVGFPSGAHTTAIKVAEMEQLVRDGVDEADVMLNVGMLRSGHDGEVLQDLRAVVAAARPVPIKVILEVQVLTDDEIKRACTLAIEAGAAFVKTSTGWLPGSFTLEQLALITGFVGSAIRVKASGGIRDLPTLRELLRLGVARFGINLEAAVALLDACDAEPGGALEV